MDPEIGLARLRGARWPARMALLLAASIRLSTVPGLTAEQRESLLGSHVVAHFPPRARDQAHIAVAEGDELAARLQTDLGVRLGERAEIVICPTHSDFERAAGKRMGVWVLGLAMSDENRVLVKELPPTSFRRLVRHEVVHLFMGAALGSYDSRAPRWLHEGAAKYYGADWSGREMAAVSDAARSGRLHDIGELQTFPTNPDEAALAYAESYLLIEYLASLDPANGVADFVANLKETEDVGRAFHRAYGLSEAEVQAGWRDLIARRSRRVPIPWAVEAAIFFAMVVIFMVALRRVRRRSREIRERMEQEELLERLFDETRRRDPTSRLGRWG